MKMTLDGERRQREMDPVLGIQVPAVLPTLRTLTEQFPTQPIVDDRVQPPGRVVPRSRSVRTRSAGADAISARTSPTTRTIPGSALGELYERRLKDPDTRARGIREGPAELVRAIATRSGSCDEVTVTTAPSSSTRLRVPSRVSRGLRARISIVPVITSIEITGSPFPSVASPQRGPQVSFIVQRNFGA